MEIISKTQVMEYNTPVLIGCIVFIILFAICMGLYLIHKDLHGFKVGLVCGIIVFVISCLIGFIIMFTRIPTDRYQYEIRVDDPTAFAEILKEHDNVKLKNGICTFEDRCE